MARLRRAGRLLLLNPAENGGREAPQFSAGSVAPPTWYQLSVVPVGLRRAEGDQRQAVGARLEASDRVLGDADSIPRTDVADLVVQLHAARAVDDDVNLLLLAMPVAEGGPEVRRESLVAEAEVAALERVPAKRASRSGASPNWEAASSTSALRFLIV